MIKNTTATKRTGSIGSSDIEYVKYFRLPKTETVGNTTRVIGYDWYWEIEVIVSGGENEKISGKGSPPSGVSSWTYTKVEAAYDLEQKGDKMKEPKKEDLQNAELLYEKILDLQSELRIMAAQLDSEILKMRRNCGLPPGITWSFDHNTWVKLQQEKTQELANGF